MPTTIYTGNHQCRVVNLIECPAGSNTMEVAQAPYVYSSTVGDSIKCCLMHKGQKEFTAEQELMIQQALTRALDHKRGHVLAGGRLVKSSAMMKHWEGKKINTNCTP